VKVSRASTPLSTSLVSPRPWSSRTLPADEATRHVRRPHSPLWPSPAVEDACMLELGLTQHYGGDERRNREDRALLPHLRAPAGPAQLCLGPGSRALPLGELFEVLLRLCEANPRIVVRQLALLWPRKDVPRPFILQERHHIPDVSAFARVWPSVPRPQPQELWVRHQRVDGAHTHIRCGRTPRGTAGGMSCINAYPASGARVPALQGHCEEVGPGL
jgi:hypothetical protein